MASLADAPPLSSEDSEVIEYNLDLRIASVFVILVAGFCGGLAPILFKFFRNPAHPATLLLRSLAAGVILALAVIHVSFFGSRRRRQGTTGRTNPLSVPSLFGPTKTCFLFPPALFCSHLHR